MKDSNVCTCFFRSSVIGSIFLKPVLVWFSICVIIGACLLVFGVSVGIFLESVLVWMSFRGAEVLRRHEAPSHKVLLWDNNNVSWARSALLHGIYCISNWIKFAKLQLHAKKCICCKNSKYPPDEIFVGPFALAEWLPISGTLCEKTTKTN